MKEKTVKLSMFTAACLLAGAAVAATGSSNEFRLDCRTGVRTAASVEKIQYSTAWATNLTAAQQGEAKAVVKVNPCLKTPPKYLVVDMSGGRSAARWPISYLDEVPSGVWTDEYKTEKLVLRYIPAGSFIMGGRATDYPGAVNTNLHMVTLTKDFYMGVFEVTQRQWELAMGNRPSAFSNETCYATRPVESISYVDIRGGIKGITWPESKDVDEYSFMGQLRKKAGLTGFDLPTEAQWEYACRAGTTTALNSGKNISNTHTDSVDAIVDPAVDEVARYHVNSGAKKYESVESFILEHSSDDVINGSAKVGSYMPNKLGLYDFHGNVYEFCLDAFSEFSVESVDPIGTKKSSWRLIRGGSWFSGSFAYASFYRGASRRDDTSISTVGFRLCLHGGELPEVDDSVTLVNASGAAAADWTPTRAGTYQLTHEVQVDGVTVAPMESALFKVEGPELEIVPMGELTNGVAVKVEKVGGGGEWTVYYSLDGSEPTAGSTVYEGPFALPASATVKAVAISAGGVSSEVASRELALHPALNVDDIAARQRWPWNGKVDIDCEVKGDASKKYAVTFSVEDEIGHTNLPIRTVGADVLGGPQPQNNENALDGGSGVPGGHALPFVLSPGKYRFVWDAAADLPKGTRFGGVSVSINAVPSPLADWKRVVEITVDGYAGSETLTDVPLLVRLSSAIDGFDYNDFAAPDTGADMIFTDMEGTARYPYEIDEWHKGGECLVWVKLPELKKGTKFKLAYGSEGAAREDTSSTVTTVPSPSSATGAGKSSRDAMKHAVWADYAGVWHMNEDSGTAFDSTEHGLDAQPDHGTNNLADVSQMVAYENGACGRARVNATQQLTDGNLMVIPSYDALDLDGRFVVSAWVKGEDDPLSPRLFSRKNYWSASDGWEVCIGWPTATMRGASSNSAYFERPSIARGWIYFACEFFASEVRFYTNGVLHTCSAIDAYATDNGRMLAVGGILGADASHTLCGQYDEIRLRGGTLSADRIKADYDMIANRNFCTYGKVEGGAGK